MQRHEKTEYQTHKIVSRFLFTHTQTHSPTFGWERTFCVCIHSIPHTHISSEKPTLKNCLHLNKLYILHLFGPVYSNKHQYSIVGSMSSFCFCTLLLSLCFLFVFFFCQHVHNFLYVFCSFHIVRVIYCIYCSCLVLESTVSQCEHGQHSKAVLLLSFDMLCFAMHFISIDETLASLSSFARNFLSAENQNIRPIFPV